jgi:hypothetical protein
VTFSGFLTLFDRPKPEARQAIADLARLGVSTRVITGDSRLVAQHVAELVGLRAERTLTGAELNAMNDEALWHRAERTDLFVEVDPHQKERIILALKKTGHVVGFSGTASTMPRPCTPPTPAYRSKQRWTSRARPPTSSSSSATSASSDAGSSKVAGRLPTPSNSF